MQNTEKQHIVFVTSAEFAENGEMEHDNNARLNAIAGKLYDGSVDARRILFITEGSLASLETAYHLEDQICYWGKRKNEEIRRLCLRFDFWARPSLEDILNDISCKRMLNEDLWLFVGTSEYILRIMAVLLPDRYEVYGMFPGSIPSAMCIGNTVSRKYFLNIESEVGHFRLVH